MPKCLRRATKKARHVSAAGFSYVSKDDELITIMVWLERSFGRHADVTRLLVGQLRQLNAKLFEVKRRNLLVQMLWQDIDLVLIVFTVGPKLDLREHLISEACRHHKAGMSGCTT